MASATDGFYALAEGAHHISEDFHHVSALVLRLLDWIDTKMERERWAAVCLQTTLCGLLARRLVQSLRGEQHPAVCPRALTWPS